MVAGIFDQGEKDIFRITFSDGRSAEACADHLWEVDSCKFSGPRVLATSEIAALISRERYQNRLYVPRASGHFGHSRELPLSPWLLGVLIGNGCLLYNRVSISTADAATLWRVQQVVGTTGRVTAANGYDYGIRGLNGENAVMLALRSLGLMGKRSEEKFIPELYLTASREARLELMRGLMDTDGWVEAFGVVRFSTSSPRLAQDAAELARSLGGLCTIAEKVPHYEHKGERREGLPHFVCTIRHDTPSELVTLLRKKRRCVRKKVPRLTIQTVEFVGRQQARCISVSHPSHLYVTDDYIVTHNTIVGANIARATAAAGNGCLLFSLEMPAEEIGARILSDQAFRHGSPITSKAIFEGHLDAHQMQEVEKSASDLAGLNLLIDTSAGLSVGEILARTRSAADEMKARGARLRVVVIDYLKFVRASDRYRGQRVYEVGEITAGLKALAKDLGVCVVLLAQLSRAVEQRADKRPELSDLRESGDIEADADVVLLLFREAYYLKDKTDPDSMARLLACENALEIIIAKCRMGAVGVVETFCHPGASTVRDRGTRGYGR
ncbi:DnaB-like helicase C-terminal domain-containing protein [Xanthobacter sp. V3C-3]|uniref:DnaB-like helicase C-terminal domain-containing protein n=1 Tax=Xanthobacter lutulentifluminis TaxID=3119935 RepID=UPI00372BE0CE